MPRDRSLAIPQGHLDHDVQPDWILNILWVDVEDVVRKTVVRINIQGDKPIAYREIVDDDVVVII
ncbi:MAG TPA: hypothetical protein PLP48_00360 [Acholeplasmataceae bacterium]|nr:hypothetical protein [Acholeplasmataceae bacterium]